MASSSDAPPLSKQKDAARVVYPAFNEMSRYSIGGANVINDRSELSELIGSWPAGLQSLFPKNAQPGSGSCLHQTIHHTNAKYGLQLAGDCLVATSSHCAPRNWKPDSYVTLEMHWVGTDTGFICWELTGLIWITNTGRANNAT